MKKSREKKRVELFASRRGWVFFLIVHKADMLASWESLRHLRSLDLLKNSRDKGSPRQKLEKEQEGSNVDDNEHGTASLALLPDRLGTGKLNISKVTRVKRQKRRSRLLLLLQLEGRQETGLLGGDDGGGYGGVGRHDLCCCVG